MNEGKKQVFKSFFYWTGDTLKIDGAFGLFTGIGFSIKIYNNKATLYHLLSSDENPCFAYNETDSITFRLNVPCNDTKIILSETPDSTKNHTIYGCVEFKSKDFYQSGMIINGKETEKRNKMRSNMKIYFKAKKLDFSKLK